MSDNLDLSIFKVLLTNKKHAIDFANECDAKLFTAENWTFANVIISYIKLYKDIPTLRVLTEKSVKNPKLADTISKAYNAAINCNYDELDYKHDLERLKKRFAENQILNVKTSLSKIEQGSVDVDKTISEMSKTIQNIKNLSQVKSYERKTLKEASAIFREEYKAKQTDPDFDRGIRTGYSYLDNATDGLRPGELLLIGAESGGGKSMFLMNMAIQMWLQKNNVNMMDGFTAGNDVLYFSLEMPFKPCLNRVLARLAEAPSKKLRNASLNNEEALRVKKALKFVERYNHQFEIVDIPRGATMESLEAIYEDAKLNYDPKIIVIDYLGLMDYEGGANMDDWLKLGKIAEKIHEFARVHNVIVLSAVQLNRVKGGKEAEDKIGLHRVGRSALILQNANIAIQIETRQQERTFPDMYYHVIKNRDGELLKGRLIKNLACGTLLDDPTDEDGTEFFDVDDISEKASLIDL